MKCLPGWHIYNVMLRNTATSWISQNLKCHIRIPDPLVTPQYNNLLLSVISHSEVLSSLPFSSWISFSLFPGFFFYRPFTVFAFQWDFSFVFCAERSTVLSLLSQDCTGFVFIPVQVSASQPAHTYQTGWARDYWVNMCSAFWGLTQTEGRKIYPSQFTYDLPLSPPKKHSSTWADSMSQNKTTIGWITQY